MYLLSDYYILAFSICHSCCWVSQMHVMGIVASQRPNIDKRLSKDVKEFSTSAFSLA